MAQSVVKKKPEPEEKLGPIQAYTGNGAAIPETDDNDDNDEDTEEIVEASTTYPDDLHTFRRNEKGVCEDCGEQEHTLSHGFSD